MPKSLLITGGSGFLGRHLARSLKDTYNVILTGRNNKQNSFASNSTGCEVAPLDISSIESVRDIFLYAKPDIVIHAAATKFVDLAEKYPMECIDVNVVGSQNIARVSLQNNIEQCIAVSTDKAAPPVRNTYGLSKALMERVFCSLNALGDTSFSCVRYGNVAWSTGSVLPVWRQMYQKDKHIITTGPNMRRFFFTVHEAVALVEAAINNCNLVSGKVLSRYMKSAQLKHILDIWIDMFGGTYSKGQMRPGERNDEFLIGELELPYTSEISIDDIRHYLIDFNTLSESPLSSIVSSETTDRLSKEEIKSLLSSCPDESQ